MMDTENPQERMKEVREENPSDGLFHKIMIVKLSLGHSCLPSIHFHTCDTEMQLNLLTGS